MRKSEAAPTLLRMPLKKGEKIEKLLLSHVIVNVMPTFFQALDRETTDLNLKQIGDLTFHLIFHRLTVKCRFVA